MMMGLQIVVRGKVKNNQIRKVTHVRIQDGVAVVVVVVFLFFNLLLQERFFRYIQTTNLIHTYHYGY